VSFERRGRLFIVTLHVQPTLPVHVHQKFRVLGDVEARLLHEMMDRPALLARLRVVLLVEHGACDVVVELVEARSFLSGGVVELQVTLLAILDLQA
jgi:hypothetical protein